MTEFEAARPKLFRVAYALLGSTAEAEDVLQEAWLRLEGARGGAIEDVTGWLVVTVSRLALDVLRSARVRRESYVGPWLPEPVVTDADPAEQAELADSVSLALLVVLESLTPAERAVFVLREVFALPFEETAAVVGRTPAACRQMALRAKRHVAARTPRFSVDPAEHRRVVAAFAEAAAEGSLEKLLALLDADAVLRTDGGGAVRAARNPVRGGAKVARFLVGVRERFGGEERLLPAVVNGVPGLLRFRAGGVSGVLSLTVSGGRVTRIDVVMNPEKLRRVPWPNA